MNLYKKNGEDCGKCIAFESEEKCMKYPGVCSLQMAQLWKTNGEDCGKCMSLYDMDKCSKAGAC